MKCLCLRSVKVPGGGCNGIPFGFCWRRSYMHAYTRPKGGGGSQISVLWGDVVWPVEAKECECFEASRVVRGCALAGNHLAPVRMILSHEAAACPRNTYGRRRLVHRYERSERFPSCHFPRKPHSQTIPVRGKRMWHAKSSTIGIGGLKSVTYRLRYLLLL